jgi:acetylornithine deacetylase/succinyl-diaminopimelate desuccinylase-like protein
MLDRLWDGDGTLAVPALAGSEAELDYPEADLRADAGVLSGVQLLGRGSLSSRLWTRPSLTVTGIDVPSVDTASNTLLPVVWAKFSLRLPPGQDPRAAFTALHDHLHATVPWGARVEVRLGEAGRAWAGDVNGPVYDLARWSLREAYGHDPVHMGLGGSISFIAGLTEVYPQATVLVTGVEDPDTRAHGSDESLHLADFERACLAHALLLSALAGSRSG